MEAISLATLCFQASKLIYKNVKRYVDVDETLAVFTADQAELSRVMSSFHQALGEGGLMAGHGQEQWRTLKASMDDLAVAMTSLEDILRDVKGDESGAVSRVFRIAKLEMKSEQIKALTQRISTHTNAIQLAVQFLNL
jgi:hypothetical protein